MAKGLVVRLGEEVSRFQLSRLSRDKLHGKTRKLIVDDHGEECVSAMLVGGGSVLLPPSSTSQLYLDSDFNTIDRSDLKAVDAEGKPLPSIASTLGVETTLEGPVPPHRVLECATASVYVLTPSDLGGALAAALERGEIYETRFAYRKGTSESRLFLLAGPGGFFGLVGTPAEFEFCEPEVNLDDLFDGDDIDFDLLFED